MTYKEFTECARPEIISDSCTGGVFGCPTRTYFKDGEKIFSRDCKTVIESRPGSWHIINDVSVSDCVACWNTEMDVNETARAIEIYGSEWYLSALAYLEEKKHDSSV